MAQGDGGEPDGDARRTEPPAFVPMIERVPPTLVFRWAAAGALGALLVVLVAYGAYVIRGLLVLVLVALFVAVSLEPVVRWLVKRGLRRPFAVLVIVVILVALTAVFIWSIVPPLVGQGGRFIDDLPSYLRRLSTQSKAVREVTDRYHLTARLTSLLADLPGRLAGGAIGQLRRFLSVLASTLTVLVLSIYFMAALPRIQHGVIMLFPYKRRTRATEIVDVVVAKVGGYMIGNIIISLFAGVSTFICLEIVRVPFAVPLAVTVALTDLIPMIGATLGAVICVVAAVFTVGIWPRSVIVLLFFIGYQQLENYLIAPRVIRNTVDLSAVVVLLAALVGGAVLGLIGAIMAIPVTAAVKVAMSPAIAAKRGPPSQDDEAPD
jgi:predicted PurR-regulated permease PerM